MSTVLTTRLTSAANPTALTRLAERWRQPGLYLACFALDGQLLWHDNQMPRLLALSISAPVLRTLAAHLHPHAEKSEPSIPPHLQPLPGLQLHFVPISRRRRIVAWLAVLARTDRLQPTEELQRAASLAALDVQALLIAAQRLPLLPAAQIPALTQIVGQMYDDLIASSSAQHELAGVTEQLSSVYEEISLLYKISSGMRFSQKTTSFLDMVSRELQEIGNFRSVAVAFAHKEDESAQPLLGELAVLVGQCPLQGQELINALHAPIHDALILGEPQVHNDLTLASDAPKLADYFQRFICIPLMRDKRPLGVLLALDKNDHSEFTSVDLKLLSNVGSQCSIFLENAALYSDMQGLFMGVLHALTRSIDAKDAYTRGHSQRVAELSRMLAQRIGLADELCERVYLSGLLHDIGKIGVPEAVLTKPGRLSDAEFEAIKKHPALGAQIMGNIKQLQDVVPGVLYHHERWDGRGYPYGLAGEAIPLMGRIICVADAYDAMSSTRTYRPALPMETVLEEIQRCAGTQFDPTLAKLFITLDFTHHRRSVEEQLLAARQSNGGLV